MVLVIKIWVINTKMLLVCYGNVCKLIIKKFIQK
jgi:hypothetical protein